MPRIVTYNVHQCLGMDGVLSPARIASVIRECGADIVALQELDMGRMRSGLVDQAAAIAHDLEMDFHFHPALKVVDELYGDAILTSLPLHLVKAGSLPSSAPVGRFEPRGALWASIKVDGAEVQVLNTHFGVTRRDRAAQCEGLLGPDWLGHPACRDPLLLAGDFNALPTGRTYKRLTRLLRDATAEVRVATATYPARLPMLRLDHVLHSPSIRIHRVDTVRTPLARIASDHLPLLVEFTIDPIGNYGSGMGEVIDRA